MKPVIFIALILAASSVSQAQRQAPRVVSPEVLPDHCVTFRLQAPKAQEVLLTAEWVAAKR